jgi:hypothetical protein
MRDMSTATLHTVPTGTAEKWDIPISQSCLELAQQNIELALAKLERGKMWHSSWLSLRAELAAIAVAISNAAMHESMARSEYDHVMATRP